MEGTIFPPRSKLKHHEICSVDGCSSDSNLNLTIRFHHFPKVGKRVVYLKDIFGTMKGVDQFEAWKRALKMHNINPRAKVCSLHFQKEDYTLPEISARRRLLKSTAVPSCNLPGTSVAKMKRDMARLQRKVNRNLKQDDQPYPIDQPGNSALGSEGDPIEAVIDTEISDSHTKFKFDQDIKVQNNNAPILYDVGVQMKSSDLVLDLPSFITSERQLSILTGIENFRVLDCIVELVERKFRDQLMHENSKMSLKQKIIMTYMKLRLNSSYSLLAILFRPYTAENCKQDFYDTLELLDDSLKCAISWPSKEEISRNIPKCFKDFEDVRVVVDCTEILIQEPENFCCEMLTQSNKKKSRTGKIMTGVAPDGSIVYISKAWGGRATDTMIFEGSDIRNLLEVNDAVMADEEFHIEKLCAKNFWKLIRPPSLKNKLQISKAESIVRDKIAEARVHIDRSNQRIKTFKILDEMMPIELVPQLEKIFRIVCATLNLCAPILEDNEFIK